jgi:hypothetical protein
VRQRPRGAKRGCKSGRIEILFDQEIDRERLAERGAKLGGNRRGCVVRNFVEQRLDAFDDPVAQILELALGGAPVCLVFDGRCRDVEQPLARRGRGLAEEALEQEFGDRRADLCGGGGERE